MEVQEPVCPESTIESAVQRNAPPKKVLPPVSISNDESTFKGERKLACESTIDSSLRRGFLKKAALIGAAAAVGSTLLGSRIIPESSMSSCESSKGASVHPDDHVFYCCVSGPVVEAFTCYGPAFRGESRIIGGAFCGYAASLGSIAVNGGTICGVAVRGSACNYPCNNAPGTGVCGFSWRGPGVQGVSNCGPGVYAVSYFGNAIKAVGNCHATAVCVVGSSAASKNVFVNTDHTNNGSSLYPGIVFGGCGSGEGIADARACGSPNQYGLDFYTGSAKRMSITNAGKVGIGTVTPCRTLCVNGGIFASSSSHPSVEGFSVCQAGVVGFSYHSPGVEGFSFCNGPGVLAESTRGLAIQATAFTPLVAEFKNSTCSGDRSSIVKFENADSSPVDWNAGVAGVCNACKIPDGSFYVGQPAKPRVVVNSCGNFGVGTLSPATTLQVNGSVGAKVATPSCSTYCVQDNCFAVLVNATSAAKTVNLPKAIQGMILYIKNTGTDFGVIIKPKSGDTIEGATSKSLAKKDGVTLIAGGNSPATWYIISYIS